MHCKEVNRFFESPTAAHPMMVVPRRVRARESNCMTWNAAPVVEGYTHQDMLDSEIGSVLTP